MSVIYQQFNLIRTSVLFCSVLISLLMLYSLYNTVLYSQSDIIAIILSFMIQ
ncbi:hypothetical protein BDF14DRAFT_1828890 [Spinellus fusiger]|nr:hypothetical protein BDF14DRAFT_1828890 [Spinellus fusiger]